MPQPRRRHHQRPRASELCREAADHYRAQRDAVHDIGALGAHDLQRLKEIAQAAQRTKATAPALDRDHGKSFGPEPLAVLAHARRHRDLQAAIPRRLRHRQEMRDKEPVFGDEVKDFGHDWRRPDPSLFRRPLAPPNRGRLPQYVLYASPQNKLVLLVYWLKECVISWRKS